MAGSRKMIGLKLSQHKLMQLFRMGVLCGADIQCLDIEDRDFIKQLCLQTCSEKLCAHCEHSHSCGTQQAMMKSCSLPTIHQIQIN